MLSSPRLGESDNFVISHSIFKLVISLDVLVLSKSFTERAPHRLSVRLSRNHDSEARESILKIAHLLSRNGVKRRFHRKSLRCCSDDKHHKTT